MVKSFHGDATTLSNLYNEKGMSLKQIARHLNIAYSTVHYWMEKSNIPRRPFLCYNISKATLVDLYIDKRLGTSQIAKKFGCNEETIRKKLLKNNITIRSNSESKTRFPKRDFDGTDEEKAYLIGFRTGDLHVRMNHASIRVSSTSTHISFINLVNSCYERYGHVNVHPWSGGGLIGKRVVCDLNRSFEFLMEKSESIPRWILSNDDVFFHFLAGYSDAEGCWSISGNGKGGVRYRFAIGSEDIGILRGLDMNLKKLGYHPHIYLHCKKGTDLGYGPCHKDFYDIVLCRNGEVTKLATRLIALTRHPEKKSKIRIILTQYRKWTDAKSALDLYRKGIKRYLLN